MANGPLTNAAAGFGTVTKEANSITHALGAGLSVLAHALRNPRASLRISQLLRKRKPVEGSKGCLVA